MASDWFVLPEALCRARLAQLITQEELAKRSGVSVRSIRAYERTSQRTQVETLQCLAKTLATEVKHLAVLRVRGSAPPPAPRASEPPTPPMELLSAIPPRTQLEVLVDHELRSGILATPIDTPRGRAETLTAKRLQDVFTAYALHEGYRYVLEARIEGMRGILPPEAKLLGSRGGIAARFHLVKEIAPGKTIGITIHSGDSGHTKKLQKLYSKRARVCVRVVLAPGEPQENGPGFSSFITKVTSLRPWAFLVEEVSDAIDAGGARQDSPQATVKTRSAKKTVAKKVVTKKGARKT